MKPIYVVILVVVIAAAAFWGGVTYQKSKTPSFAGARAGANGGYGRRFGSSGAGGGFGGASGASGMMPVSGQIVSNGNNTITVKLSDGSSKIVDLTSKTKINKTTQGTVSDLTTGQQVTAFGSTNSDGSITAQAVNLGNSMFRIRTGGPGGSQSGQSSSNGQ